MSIFEKVKQFREKAELPMSFSPTLLSDRDFLHNVQFLQKKLYEISLYHNQDNLTDTSESIVDLIYYALGLSAHMGIPFDLLFDEIHQRNLERKSNKNSRRYMRDEYYLSPPLNSPLTNTIISSYSYEKSDLFRDLYNKKILEIWKKFKVNHQYLPNQIGEFSLSAPICFIGMNPSFNESAILRMMNSDEDLSKCDPKILFANADENIDVRINLIQRLEKIARKEYDYYLKIKDFIKSLGIGWTDFAYLDLLLVRETSQENALQFSNDYPEFKNAQIDLLIEYINLMPIKYICVINAEASKIIFTKLTGSSDYKSSIQYEGKIIFFSGMLSGQRSLDVFARERLKEEICKSARY